MINTLDKYQNMRYSYIKKFDLFNHQLRNQKERLNGKNSSLHNSVMLKHYGYDFEYGFPCTQFTGYKEIVFAEKII